MKQEMTVNPRSFYFNPRVFFRSGKTREWLEQLTPEQVARIDEKTARIWNGQIPRSAGEIAGAG